VCWLANSFSLSDQYVIPGNIIYKQRGTIWHPGENTIMGRDHTIHAAVAGYVKYYRDPNRHPDRQYIGVVFNRDDKLPYPPGTPRRRKLNLAAVPRKDEAPTGEIMSPSGIPLAVTRHDPIPEPEPKPNTTVKAQPETNESASPSEQPVALTDGNSVILRLIQEKLQARAKREAKEEAKRLLKERQLKERMATRVLRLQSNYSYRETNWDIGRLVGDAGTLIGTEETGESRKSKFRLRKRKRRVYFKHIKSRREARAARRREHRRRVQAKRERLLLERAEAAAKEQAEKNAAAAAAAAAAGGTTADQGKVEA
jgi:protein phosphatase inhibitor 2